MYLVINMHDGKVLRTKVSDDFSVMELVNQINSVDGNLAYISVGNIGFFKHSIKYFYLETEEVEVVEPETTVE